MFYKPRFNVEFLEEAVLFLESLDDDAREKIIYNITKARFLHDSNLFKKLTKDIWEFRTLYNRTYYRIFAFWDKTDRSKTLVIATHGITKKKDKISDADLAKADQLMRAYFKGKT